MTRREAGFTLVEMLVAISVTAFLLLTVYGVFASVSGAREKIETEGETFHLARVIFDRIGREVRGAYWTPQNPRTRFSSGLNEENQPFLEFSTTTATPQSGGGIVLVRYELRQDSIESGRMTLVRQERPMFVDEFRDTDQLALATTLDSLNFRFFAQDTWRDAWSGAEGLPQLVEVSLALHAGPTVEPFMSAFQVAPLQAGP